MSVCSTCMYSMNVSLRNCINGYTHDLTQRLIEHQREGQWVLAYYEAYKAESDARRRERQLKHHAQALTALKTRLTESLQRDSLGVGFNSRTDLHSLSFRKSGAH